MNIDLHWRINNRQILANSLNLNELHDNGQILSLLNEPLNNEQSSFIMTPSPVHSLLIACIHRVGHHSHEERLAWLYDIHLLSEKLSELEWQTLIELTKLKKISAITLDALQLCQTLLSTDIPEFVLSTLIVNSKEPEPSQVFLQRHLPERSVFRHDLKALPSIKAKWQLIKETVIPKPAYIRQRMDTKFALWGYVKRFYQGIKRVF